MNEKEKIDILFKEYEALRTEIQNRIKNRSNFTTISIALLAIFTNKTNDISVYLIIIASIFILIVWWRIRVWILRCGDRVAEIENEINELADCKILKWENYIREKNWTL